MSDIDLILVELVELPLVLCLNECEILCVRLLMLCALSREAVTYVPQSRAIVSIRSVPALPATRTKQESQ